MSVGGKHKFFDFNLDKNPVRNGGVFLIVSSPALAGEEGDPSDGAQRSRIGEVRGGEVIVTSLTYPTSLRSRTPFLSR
jgi:hypothetical protein